MNRKTKRWIGITLIVVPVVFLTLYPLYHFYSVKTTVSEKSIPKAGKRAVKGIEINVDHPPKDFFDPKAQLIVAFGTCFASICSGVAMIIKARKG